MVHWWQDPVVEARITADYYGNVTFLLLGVYGWEYCQNFGVEYGIIRRRLPFRWSLFPYLIGRLSFLINITLVGIQQGPFSNNFPCEPGNALIMGTGGIAIASSSANFMIRTWVIWKDSHLVHIVVLLAAVGHCTMLIINLLNIKSTGSNGACSTIVVSLAVNAGVYMYTMCYDFLVLILFIVKLSKQSSKRSFLKERLRSQHLLYFAVAAMSNIPPTVFALLGSDAMVGITSVPAVTAITIVSCRAVKSLLLPRTEHICHQPEGDADDQIALTTQLPHVPPGLHSDFT